jgi:hypothetical protein
VTAIRADRSTSTPQKRRELDALRARYTDAMAAQRTGWNDAMQAAQEQAVRAIMRPGNGRQVKDSYHSHRRQLRNASLAQLAEELDWAEVAEDSVLLQVVASLAFQRMTPAPGDPATRLVERVVNQRLSNGSLLFPDMAGGYQRWARPAPDPGGAHGGNGVVLRQRQARADTRPGPGRSRCPGGPAGGRAVPDRRQRWPAASSGRMTW